MTAPRIARRLALAALPALALSGCGDPVGDWIKGMREKKPAAAEAEAERPPAFELNDTAPMPGEGPPDLVPDAPGFSLAADGPGVCFRLIAEKFGADVKVSEVSSFFGGGEGLDSIVVAPRGQMTSCSVSFQSPADPRKLLSARYDLRSGSFGAPQPVEIRVMGGNAATFRLSDHVIPLSRVDAAALSGLMKAQDARLKKVFSDYAWTGVRLSGPDPFSSSHRLRLDLNGRIAANDLKSSGYASVSLDGKRITADYLMP